MLVLESGARIAMRWLPLCYLDQNIGKVGSLARSLAVDIDHSAIRVYFRFRFR